MTKKRFHEDLYYEQEGNIKPALL